MGMMFWRLLLGTVAMLAFGYAGEAQFVNPWVGFCAGMCGWFFILFEIFAGEAGNTASGTNKYVAASFSTMRLIVTVGWSIYPMGYFFGYLMGSVQDSFGDSRESIKDIHQSQSQSQNESHDRKMSSTSKMGGIKVQQTVEISRVPHVLCVAH